MSDLLAAAAAALGAPEDVVQRSAEARAAETGASVDDILAAWAGGAPAPMAASSSTEEASTEEIASPASEPDAPAATPAPEIIIETTMAEEAPVAARPSRPPVLIGARDNPMTILLGAVGLFLVILLVGLLGPSVQGEVPGARSSEIPYSDAAVEGKGIYAALGCGSCHTQIVRPVIADVGLGTVTLNDSNQVLGTRRFGPDLSDAGTRITADQIEEIITGFGEHPAHSLGLQDMSALVAYLTESSTSEQGS